MATMKNKVIWQEGLFALPQHFQQQQRHCEYLLTRRLDALGDFFWGFTELSINTELLAQGKIMIDRRAVDDYLTLIGEKELPSNLFEIVGMEDRFPVERVNKRLNAKH